MRIMLLPWLACLAAGAARAAPALYRYDTVHSQILFSIDHDGFSRPFGRLPIARGWLRFDPDNLADSATALEIDLSALDMGDAAWNRAVLGPALLDAGQDRYARFVSTSVERVDASHGVLHGRLTLHGTSRPLAIAFTVNRVGATIYGMHRVAGFSATATLDRDDFGITGYPHAIGHSVQVWLSIEAIRDAHVDTTLPDPHEASR